MKKVVGSSWWLYPLLSSVLWIPTPGSGGQGPQPPPPSGPPGGGSSPYPMGSPLNSAAPGFRSYSPFPDAALPSVPASQPAILVTPSIQPSPGHFTSTDRDPHGPKSAPVLTREPGNHSDPKWETASREYEKDFKKYQEDLDRLLTKYDWDWEAISKNPTDRKRCEEILKRWKAEELALKALYSIRPGPHPGNGGAQTDRLPGSRQDPKEKRSGPDKSDARP